MSKIEVDTIDKQSGSTLTLGGSGTAVTLASGATQSGFGRTGTVDWDTTPKTATFTAVSGDGFFCNTTGGAFTCNLPAGTAGSIVSLADYAGTWDSNALTVSPNGSQKIGGASANVILNTEGQSVTLIYADDTQGWVNVQDSTSNVRGNPFIVATGGTITTSGNFKIHTFTGPGTFTVSNVGSGTPTAPALVDYLVVAGGGGSGGGEGTGGGGGGGYRESPGTASGCYSVSPRGAAPAVSLPVSVQAYPITVGAGGTAGPQETTAPGGVGGTSTFSSITSTGGGGGGGGGGGVGNGLNGGSGGGGGGRRQNCGVRGTGNTPPVNPAQGSDGGSSINASSPPCVDAGGGGGGAVAAGTEGSTNQGGNGGTGATSSINGTPTGRAGGGGAGSQGGGSPPGAAGSASQGGGAGGNPGVAGSTNTGGGGGGISMPGSAGTAGGSGIVIIRYKFQ
jgi:hypothetical protein